MTTYNLTLDPNTGIASGAVTGGNILAVHYSAADNPNTWTLKTSGGTAIYDGTTSLNGDFTLLVLSNGMGTLNPNTLEYIEGAYTPTVTTDPNLTSGTYEEVDGVKTYFAKAFKVTDDGNVIATTTDGEIALSLDPTFLASLLTSSDITGMLTESDLATLTTNISTSANITGAVVTGSTVTSSGDLNTGGQIVFADGSKLGHGN